MLGESRERQTGSSSLRGSCSHGSPFGKRPLLPSPPHPGPMTHCPWGFRDSLAAGQIVGTTVWRGDPGDSAWRRNAFRGRDEVRAADGGELSGSL